MQTSDGKAIQILDFGYLNEDAGPDFFNAKIILDRFIWVGNIEIHIKASDWIRHKHQNDKAYDNVILHVVLEEDEDIFNREGNKIPCLELKNRIDPKMLSRYRLMNPSNNWVPCSGQLAKVDPLIKFKALEIAAISRLEKKLSVIHNILSKTGNNWELTFRIMLFRYFGVKVNLDAFEKLAWSFPHIILEKEKSNIENIEALLFGLAGMLDREFKDDYPKRLKFKYEFFALKYSLRSMAPTEWKFLRMRPVSFPTIRIALLSSLLFRHQSFFDKIRSLEDLSTFYDLFDTQVSHYWKDHYLFDIESKTIIKKSSKSFKDMLLINVVSPFFLCYGMEKNDISLKEKALSLLEKLPFEKNKITKRWIDFSMPDKSALESQGLLSLKRNYCERKKCLQCPIGVKIMNY